MIRPHPCSLLFRTAFHVDIIGFRRSLLPFTQLRLILPMQYGHSPVTSRGYPPQVPSIVSWVTNPAEAMARAVPLPASAWLMTSCRIMPLFISVGISASTLDRLHLDVESSSSGGGDGSGGVVVYMLTSIHCTW